MDNNLTNIKFTKAEKLPKNSSIHQLMNFVHLGSEVILVQNSNGTWGPVLGETDKNDDWQSTLIEYTYAQTGVSVDTIAMIGFISYESKERGAISSREVSLVCYSYCKQIPPSISLKRELFSHSNIREYLSKNNRSLLNIYEEVHSAIKQHLQLHFSFIPDEISTEIIITSVMVFCVNDKKQVCIVKDGEEEFYSLPGGGRKLLESPLECAKRELLEEAQITGRDFKPFGSIKVDFDIDGIPYSSMLQARYFCRADLIEDFIPFRNGFETSERKFVAVDELTQFVKQLQNKDGERIIMHLKTKLGS